MKSRQARITQRISQTIAVMALVVAVLNTFNLLVPQSAGIIATLTNVNIWLLALFAAFFWLSRYLPEKPVQIFQVTILLLLSGPMVLTSYSSFFGMWFVLLGTVLLYKYGFLQKHVTWKLILLSAYFVPWLVLAVLNHEGTAGKELRIVNDLVFLVSCFVFLYFIFEEDIRTLVTANSQKDADLAEKTFEIARMEPLSVLGERVAHVTHSFKNHQTQLAAIASILEDTGDAQKGAELINQVNADIGDRIENILTVSRAGVDLNPETFDVARVLEGIKFVYLTEPTFAKHVWNETTISGSLMITAVRWDFILMVENILKNALDAIREKGVRGIVRINLTTGLLTIANNGGAMERCENCRGDCLNCSIYGHLGRTSKKGGSGHGLHQVFGTCRKNHWPLRIRTEDEWTIFKILLAAPPSLTPAPAATPS